LALPEFTELRTQILLLMRAEAAHD
jgi:hypothetical protein